MLLIAELSAYDLEKKSLAFILSYLLKRKKTEDLGKDKIQGLFSYSSRCTLMATSGSILFIIFKAILFLQS